MRKTKTGVVWAGVAVIASSALAWAHYPMAITPKGMTEPGEAVEFLLTNGHPFMNDRFNAPRPEKVGVYPPERRYRSLISKVTSATTAQGTRAFKVRYTPKEAGDYIFSFHTGEVREKPQRRVVDFVKLILHVRHESGAQVGWRRVIGDPLEIVPLTRPYAIPVGTAFRGKVVFNTRSGPRGREFQSQPMLEGVVEAESFTPDRRPGWAYLPRNRLAVQTDDNGIFSVTLPQAGWWLLSCATDGGPGEQGSTKMLVRRAVLWLYVGDTVWDRTKKSKTKATSKRAARPKPQAKVTAMIYSGRPDPSFRLTKRKDLLKLQGKLQNLLLAGRKPPSWGLGDEAFMVETDYLWDVSRVLATEGFVTIYDGSNEPVVYRDKHDLRGWLREKALAAGIKLRSKKR
jgi:cobalt/nickel transport protein